MSNYAWVCFECRTVARRPGSSANVKCRTCRAPCECVGYKTPIPPKAKVKAWNELCAAYYSSRRALLLQRSRNKVAQRHSLEREIQRLKALPANEGRSIAAAELTKQLRAIGA
jgi:hypothetical protein